MCSPGFKVPIQTWPMCPEVMCHLSVFLHRLLESPRFPDQPYEEFLYCYSNWYSPPLCCGFPNLLLQESAQNGTFLRPPGSHCPAHPKEEKDFEVSCFGTSSYCPPMYPKYPEHQAGPSLPMFPTKDGQYSRWSQPREERPISFLYATTAEKERLQLNSKNT